LPEQVTDRQRRRSLTAAITAVTGFGLGIGLSAPLLSLLLDAQGISPALTGVNAAAAFVGVIAGSLLAPLGVRRLRMRPFLLLCFGVQIVLAPALKLFPGYAAWLVLRLIGGLFGAALFTASEAWINLLAGDAHRGRVLGLYGAALAAGFGTGPLVLSLTGIHGWTPFVVDAAIMAAATLPVLAAGQLTDDLTAGPASHPLAMVRRAPLIMAAVGLFGLYEASLMALLPLWAVRLGFSTRLAAATLTAVYFGSVVLQGPIGILSDRMDRHRMLLLCGLGSLLGVVVVALLARPDPALLPVIALWGGLASAIYPVALSLAGDRFHGPDLMSVNAAIIIAYGLGALVGPGLGGMAMDLWNPQGLLVFFIVLFAAFCCATLAGDRRAGNAAKL
jgi:MFS family permease